VAVGMAALLVWSLIILTLTMTVVSFVSHQRHGRRPNNDDS